MAVPGTPRGVVRLLNTAGGRVLCLAGDVDGAAVDSFLRRYGREPVQIDVIDAGSVTSLSSAALELVHEHLAAAGCADRPVELRLSAALERLLGPDRAARPDAGGGCDLLVHGAVAESRPGGQGGSPRWRG